MSTIPFSSILRQDRVRLDYGNVEELAQSLYEKGFIHPLCINHANELIAGGRRSAAVEHLLKNRESYPPDGSHASMQGLLTTGELAFGVHYTLRPTETIDELSELELVENIQRKGFSWQEEVLAVKKIHLLKQRAVATGQLGDQTSWGQRNTGRLLGISLGNVNYCLQVATHLSNVDSPLWKLASLSEALQFLTKLELDKASLLLAEKVKLRSSTLPNVAPMDSSAPSLPSGFITTFDPSNFQTGEGVGLTMDEFVNDAASSPAKTSSIPEPVHSLDDEANDIAHRIAHNYSWEEFAGRLGEGAVDHIVCDPPFGIDMGMLAQAGGQGQKDIDRIADTHDKQDNINNFPIWLELCYKAMKEKGFCIWFCDAEHFQTLVELGRKVGFKVQRWPFHWIKTTSCMNQRAEYNFTKSVEHAIVFRKGDARLVSAQSTNWWMGGLVKEDRDALPNHPFIKPLALWQHLLKAVALPGATVLDPFSGVGSMPRAALLGGWTPITCEVDPIHHSQQIHNISEAYKSLRK